MRHRRPGLAALAAVIVAFTVGQTARSTDVRLLSELPAAEGQELIAPYELWLATFAPDEGSYPRPATPLEYAATEVGAWEVEDLIGRAEHGVFS